LIKVCTAAVALGATSLERHITLDRAMYGSDQAASIEVNSLRNFTESVRTVPKMLGTGNKLLSDNEKSTRDKLRVSVKV
jgi:N-acetylneuraminate synthase